ncbi:MAG: DsbC family protein [Candidatus Thiodiazotropha sp.]|jgi:thiol:disulfide interchange protein DsbC
MKQTKFWAGGMAGLVVALSLVVTTTVTAAPTKQNAEIDKVRESMSKLLSGNQVTSVNPSPIPGVYEVLVGPQLYYVSADGKYLLTGKLYDIDSREDLTSPKVAQVKADMIDKVSEQDMIIFAPEKYDHTVTVFTDIDCGYCRKLHSEIKQYNDRGIRVRYLMFPRAGIGSPSYKKAVNVFCAEDRNTALTQAKAGKQIEEKECENPVAREYALGQALGVTGTPAIFLENGELVPGYVPADRMAAMLKEMATE